MPDIQKQQVLADFVNKHVLYNVTELVSVSNKLQDEFFEEEMNIYTKNEDGEPQEIFEYWLVSDWFFKELRQKRQPTTEIVGLLIWGRTCTGQAIFLDGVIEQIYDSWLNEHLEATE